MAAQLVRGGGTLDIPTADENAAAAMGHVRAFVAEQQEIAQARQRENLRGVKLLRRDTSLTTPATTRITTADGITPEQGYVWCVLMVSAQLASAGTFQAFITSDTDTTRTAAQQRRLVASGASNQYQAIPIGKNACVLLPGEGLFLNAGQNITAYFLSGWEIPAEMQGKLL
jgi:hypothetical protein